MTLEQADNVMKRVLGIYKNTLPKIVEIWTKEGIKRGDRVAKTICTCGALLSNQQAPNDIQLRVYTDEEWEKIFDCDSIHPWMIPLPKYDVWRCPVCKSIYVYEGSKQTPIMTYRLET